MSWKMPERDRITEILAGTHAIIDLDRYTSNIRLLQAMAGPDRELMAIVKANAYGHGAVECAAAAFAAGATYAGVARIDEALELRRAGVTGRILVIGPPNPAEAAVAISNQVELTVATEESLEAVERAASEVGRPATVHLKADTGLHRYGALPELFRALARRLRTSQHITFEGLYTHYSSADDAEPEPTERQIEMMSALVRQVSEDGPLPRYIHLANSAGIIKGYFPETNLVRAGIANYGLDPSDEVPVNADFKQVLTLRTIIARRFTLPAGESVSYNRTYTPERDEEAASVPIGYADGLERHLSNTGWFSHRGERCPILGRVCMDQTVIRVPDGAREGDFVTVLGDGSTGEMTVREVGEICLTNTYEPVVRLAARVPRLFVRDGRVVSWNVQVNGERGSVDGDVRLALE